MGPELLETNASMGPGDLPQPWRAKDRGLIPAAAAIPSAPSWQTTGGGVIDDFIFKTLLGKPVLLVY